MIFFKNTKIPKLSATTPFINPEIAKLNQDCVQLDLNEKVKEEIDNCPGLSMKRDSPVYRTLPIDVPDSQNDFINAVTEKECEAACADAGYANTDNLEEIFENRVQFGGR